MYTVHCILSIPVVINSRAESCVDSGLVKWGVSINENFINHLYACCKHLIWMLLKSLLLLTCLCVCVFWAPAAAKSLLRQRRRKSWSKLWRSWSFICRKRSGTRAASRQRSTLWNMPCAASDRWRVSNAFKLSLHKSSIMMKHLPGHRDIVLLSGVLFRLTTMKISPGT